MSQDESVAPSRAVWREPLVEVTRVYQFSAAHRLHNPKFSPADNVRIYGRCNNPNGHGHSYRLEVTICGPVSTQTGKVVGDFTLDEVVQCQVIQRFDRMNLDLLITPADGPTATTEVLAAMIWRILDGVLMAGQLCRLRLEETPNNFFELDRDAMSAPGNPICVTPADRGQKVSPI
jgi:6-pyruvoyltetrahydropterin/6-carboxytetrahydropterin synthase